jgi:hypothetical protein
LISRNRVVAGIAVLALAPFTFLACGDDDNDVDDAASRVQTEVAGAQTGVAGNETPGAGAGQHVTVDLEELNTSGVRGEVTLRSEGANRTRVEIRLDGQADDDYRAGIYSGRCEDFRGFGAANANRDEVEELDDVDDGRSETTVNRSMSELTRTEHAVVLREDNGGDNRVACADIEDTGFGGPGGSPTPFGGGTGGSPTPFGGGGTSGSPTPFAGGTGTSGSPTPSN